MMNTQSPMQGKVAGIALRTFKNGPMKEVDEVIAEPGAGLVGDLPVKPDRGITFISKEQWQETVNEMGSDLPWHSRRANVLIEGLPMGPLIDQTIQVGEVVVEIKGETYPCGLMDQIEQGLRKSLTPFCRAGVHGRVIQGGRIAVGDSFTVR
ncbi:MAG: hypothetical protein AMXMBFR84_19790 [Candidatus Hydrogenedentota bacterium]